MSAFIYLWTNYCKQMCIKKILFQQIGYDIFYKELSVKCVLS